MLHCKICFLDYDTAEVKPVVATCGHTICHSCSLRIQGKCPTCRRDSFANPATNFQILEQIGLEKESRNSSTSGNAEQRFNQMMSLTLNKLESMTEGMKDLQRKMDLLRNENQNMKGEMHKLRQENLETKDALKRLERSTCSAISNSENRISGKLDFIASTSTKLKTSAEHNRRGTNSNGNRKDERPRMETNDAHTRQCIPASGHKAEKPPILYPRHQVKTRQPFSAPPRIQLDGSLKCTSCSSVLTSSLKLSKNGVSVFCSCDMLNIVAAKEEGYKWMENYCNKVCSREPTFQQWPMEERGISGINCPRCNGGAFIIDASMYEAKPAD